MTENEWNYENVSFKRKKLLEEINDFEAKYSDVINKYNYLISEENKLHKEENSLLCDINNERYDKCDHLWVNTYSDSYYNCFGCIKCGLDYKIYATLSNMHFNIDFLNLEEKNMYNYLENNPSILKGLKTDISCDLELGMKLYREKKELYPALPDKEIIDFIAYKLNSINNKKLVK